MSEIYENEANCSKKTIISYIKNFYKNYPYETFNVTGYESIKKELEKMLGLLETNYVQNNMDLDELPDDDDYQTINNYLECITPEMIEKDKKHQEAILAGLTLKRTGTVPDEITRQIMSSLTGDVPKKNVKNGGKKKKTKSKKRKSKKRKSKKRKKL